MSTVVQRLRANWLYVVAAVWVVIVARATAPRNPLPFGTWRNQLTQLRGPDYALHWPHLRENLLQFVGGTLVMLAACGVGALVIAGIRRGDDTWPAGTSLIERLCIAAAVGMALLAPWSMALAAAGALTPTILSATLVASVLLGIPLLIAILRGPRGKDVPDREPATWARRIAWAAIALSGVAVVPVVLSPVLQLDSHVYHLALPAAYLEAGRFVAFPYNVFAQAPHSMEMLFTYALAHGNEVAAKALQFLTGLGMLGLTYAVGLRAGGKTVAVLSTLLLVTSTTFLNQWPTAYVDVAAGFAFMAAFWCFVQWGETDDRRFLMLGALTLGLFAGMRYTALHGVVACAVLVIATLWRKGATGQEWRRVCVICVLGLIFGAGGWLLKNTVQVGNPIYPMATELLGLGPRHPSEVARTAVMVARYGYGHSPVDLALLPWRLAVDDPATSWLSFRGEVLSPLWLMVLPCTLLHRTSNRWLRAARLSALATFLSWMLSIHFLRYLLPAFGLISVVVVACVVEILRDESGWRKHAGVWAVLVVCVSARWWLPPIVTVGLNSASSVGPVAWGAESRSAFIARTESNAPMFDYMESSLAPDAKVIGLWENRYYRAPRSMVGDTVILVPYWLDRFREAGSLGDYAQELRSSGYTHVLHNREFAAFRPFSTEQYGEDEITAGYARIDAFLVEQCDEQQQIGELVLYKLKDDAVHVTE